MTTHALDFGDPVDTAFRCCGADTLAATSSQELTCPGCGCEVGVRDQQVAWLTYCPNHPRPVFT